MASLPPHTRSSPAPQWFTGAPCWRVHPATSPPARPKLDGKAGARGHGIAAIRPLLPSRRGFGARESLRWGEKPTGCGRRCEGEVKSDMSQFNTRSVAFGWARMAGGAAAALALAVTVLLGPA